MANKKLTIIYTNDLHAMIDGFGKIAAYIDEEKSKADNFLYLDAGDISSGNPVVDLHQGRPIVELLNQMDLFAMAIGNHDFDYGQECFEINRKLSDFPWLGANIAVKDHQIPIQQPDPYHIFRFRDLTVGVVSVTETPPSTMTKSIEGLEFLDPLETLRKHLALRNEVDVLIALTHVGVAIDRMIAEQLEGYDLIIGGHSHSIVELEVVNGTPIVNGGAYGQVVGHLEIHYNPASHKVDKINHQFIPIESLEVVKAEIQSQVEDYFNKNAAFLQEAIATTNGLSIENLDETDAPLGNFWTDALRHGTKADIALTNNGGIRTPIYPETITRHQIYQMRRKTPCFSYGDIRRSPSGEFFLFSQNVR
ncbi:bifunctional metallophosphatase/5'-nucleotidase [Alicyclobacillus mengziensis]|uniref:Bifunctional metallophosphatase/5'-nucleotidase n=1 Tax=Alicyclobacillus mengziensis TaxID=2931921 RepID=A0A9X7VZ91_9BACL|nr:bifunctional UDP-sugar hydrolase/5'-nucleotidase [Alicyclobacillus mengziensis]QSO47310.1 bifunctional metallophosphatase/5'-nucleotidase [Alicyclobacillus mengziensis]